MKLEELCNALGFSEKEYAVLTPFFAEFQENCSESFPHFMAPDDAMKYFPYVQRDIDIRPRMEKVAGIVAGNPAAAFFADLLHYSFYRRQVWCIELNCLPHAEKMFGEDTGIFYLMIALGAFPLIEKKYEAMNIPHEMVEKLGLWVGGAVDIYAAGHNGTPGLSSRQLHWMRHSIDGELFRIGRLEFLLHEYPDWVPAAYRSRKDGTLCLLSGNGITYTADGRRPDPESVEAELIVSTLEITENSVRGFRILPNGYAEVDKITVLDLDEWESVAGANEIVPGIHIPGGESLSEKTIRESLQEAVIFFRKYFDLEIRMFVSSSWLFFYEWQKELPQSNIAAFAREGYLFPTFPLTRTNGLFFVFGRSDEDIRELPQRNSLEKAFHRVLESGRFLGDCGWLYLASDIDEYGTQKYRRQYQIAE